MFRQNKRINYIVSVLEKINRNILLLKTIRIYIT